MIDFPMQTQRGHERKKIVRPVYFLDERDSSRYAFSTNLSLGGICIITNRKELATGDTVDLYSRFFWNDPKKAIAVWTKEINDTVIRVGLTLLSEEDSH